MLLSPRSNRSRRGPKTALAIVVALGCASASGVAGVPSVPARSARAASHEAGEAIESRASHGEEGAKVATLPRRDIIESLDDAPRAPLPRLTSVGLFTQIYLMPSIKSYPLGYVHVGSSVALRRVEPLRAEGCATAWYAIEPRGFVCNDNTTILETEERHLSPTAERLLRGYQEGEPSDGPLPYGYALSLGTPMYGRLPTPDEQALNESMYGPPPIALGPWAKGHDGLASPEPVRTQAGLPWFLANGDFSPVTVVGRDAQLIRKIAPRGSMISYSSTFEAEGRTWLVTPELSVVPADRVRVYRPTSFHGVELGKSLRLPIAWIRKRPRAKWRATGGGGYAPSDEAWPLRTAVGLTGSRVTDGGRVLLETVERGAFLEAGDAAVVDKDVERPPHVGPRDKWIRISVENGTLTAYEGETAVFATLISPGIGGLAHSKYASVHALATKHMTPLGVHHIQFKDRFSVMSPDPEQKKFFISDVPYIQYFYGPFALHAAYWHEDFGEPKSGGCVNLSPADAAKLFAWTDPPLPAGWHAVRPGGPNGPGTVVEVVP
jgi:hypothetical protein